MHGVPSMSAALWRQSHDLHESVERLILRVQREPKRVSVGHGLMVPKKTGHGTVKQPCTSRMQHEGSQGRQHKDNEAGEGIAVRLTGV